MVRIGTEGGDRPFLCSRDTDSVNKFGLCNGEQQNVFVGVSDEDASSIEKTGRPKKGGDTKLVTGPRVSSATPHLRVAEYSSRVIPYLEMQQITYPGPNSGKFLISTAARYDYL